MPRFQPAPSTNECRSNCLSETRNSIKEIVEKIFNGCDMPTNSVNDLKLDKIFNRDGLVAEVACE